MGSFLGSFNRCRCLAFGKCYWNLQKYFLCLVTKPALFMRKTIINGTLGKKRWNNFCLRCSTWLNIYVQQFSARTVSCGSFIWVLLLLVLYEFLVKYVAKFSCGGICVLWVLCVETGCRSSIVLVVSNALALAYMHCNRSINFCLRIQKRRTADKKWIKTNETKARYTQQREICRKT